MSLNHKERELRLAVLIDADNVPYSNIRGMMEEIAKYGSPTTKRIYADWTRPNAAGWKNVLLDHAITPVQQYSYTQGKNSSDSALIIDAMDLLYTGKVDGFCIVSSDSDFTRLAVRLRESGMLVIGMGEKKTPPSLIAACDKFIFLEVLDGAVEKKSKRAQASARKSGLKPAEKPQDKLVAKTPAKNNPPAVVAVPEKQGKRPNPVKMPEKIEQTESLPIPIKTVTDTAIDEETIQLIESTIDDVCDDDGWAFLADVGNLISRKKPEFDPRNYGFNKLTPMLKSMTDILEIDERDSDKRGIKHVYVRLKLG